MLDNTIRHSLSRRELLLGTAAALASRGAAADTPAPGAATVSNGTGTGGFDLERFIGDCREASLDSGGQGAVREVLERAMQRPGRVLATVGEPRQAGIQTLYRAQDLTILNIVWAPLMQLMPHEHNMWALIGIYTGREDNIFWSRSRVAITAHGAASLAGGNTAGLPRDVIHSVVNPTEKLTGAIHIYGGDFFEVPRSEWDPESLREYPWDIEKAKRLFRESNERFRAWQSTECRAR